MLPLKKYRSLSIPKLDNRFFDQQAQSGASWLVLTTQSEIAFKWLIPTKWVKVDISDQPEVSGFQTLAAISRPDGKCGAVLRWGSCPSPLDPGDFLDTTAVESYRDACMYDMQACQVAERFGKLDKTLFAASARWLNGNLLWITAHSAEDQPEMVQQLRTLVQCALFDEPEVLPISRVQSHHLEWQLQWSHHPEMECSLGDEEVQLKLRGEQGLNIFIKRIPPELGMARAINQALVSAHTTYGRLPPSSLQQTDLEIGGSHWQNKVKIRVARSLSQREVVLFAGTLSNGEIYQIEANYPAQEADTFAWLTCRRELSQFIQSIAPQEKR